MINDIQPKFAKIEQNTGGELVRLMNERPLDTVLNFLASRLEKLVREKIPTVYMLSLALLFDDMFDITFSEHSEPEKKGYFTWAYLHKGMIGSCCNERRNDKTKRLFIYSGKGSLATAKDLTQKALFQKDPELLTFIVVPIVIESRIVGAMQLSLKEELVDTKESKKIEEMLLWIADHITWILFSEQVRLTNILTIAETVVMALESKDSYQANHSRNVADLVSAFIYTISRHPEYRYLLFRDSKNITGLSFVKLRLAALLHDIGKVSMSRDSFEKAVSPDIIKQCGRCLHPYYTFEILKNQSVTKEIAVIAAAHHERVDGTGYPFGLKMKELRIESQIIAFADKYDSFARKRPRRRDQRADVKAVLDKFTTHHFKSAFSEKVYGALLAIVMEYCEMNPMDKSFPKIGRIRELLGISKEEDARIPSTGTELDALLPLSEIATPVIRPDQWLTIIMAKSKKDLTHNYKLNLGESWWKAKYNRKYPFRIPIHLVKVKKHKDLYIGLYRTSDSKELAYAFCDDFAHKISKENVMAAVFLDHRKAATRQSIIKYRNLLKKEVSNMRPGDRWRLLMVSA